MTLRLYWHPFSIFPRRVRIALREKGVACDEVEIDLPGGATRGDAFRRLNPFGQVPVLEDDGLVIYESVAILEYLEERYPMPALLPRDIAQRARVRQWTQASGNYLTGPLKRWLTRLFTPEAQWDRADQTLAAREIAVHLDVLDLTLADSGDHLVGDFSLADIAYAPLVCELETIGLASLVAERAALRRWIEALRRRPSVAATAPR
ncbi:MAG: glutathione S-transferase family protein [Deltaproteobacteria bacterium]|nr:glutathione S-transferase family protein [Deltaproteobacteria bacterium]